MTLEENGYLFNYLCLWTQQVWWWVLKGSRAGSPDTGTRSTSSRTSSRPSRGRSTIRASAVEVGKGVGEITVNWEGGDDSIRNVRRSQFQDIYLGGSSNKKKGCIILTFLCLKKRNTNIKILPSKYFSRCLIATFIQGQINKSQQDFRSAITQRMHVSVSLSSLPFYSVTVYVVL